MLLLIFIYFVLFAYLAKRRLDWALMVILFSLWSYLIRFSFFGIPSTLLEGMILISFFVWIIKSWSSVWQNIKNKVHYKKINNRYPFDFEILLLLIISLIAVNTADWSNSALGVWKAYFFEPILFFIVFFNVLGKENYSKIVTPLCASTFIVSLIAVWQKISGSFVVPNFWNEIAERATSLFSYPNALGLYLSPVIMILIGWLGYIIKSKDISIKDDRFRIIKIIFLSLTILLAVLAILVAQSDGALVALISGLIVFCLLGNKKLFLITITFLIVFSGSLYFNNSLYSKIKDKVTLFDVSGQIRQQQWKETLTMLKDDNRIFIGAGLSNYKQVIKPYHQDGIFVKNHDPKWLSRVLNDPEYHKQAWQPVEIYLYPHNIFLNFWTELGLIGMLLFVWIIIKFFIIALKNIFGYSIKYSNRYFVLGLLSAMIAIVVHGLVDVPYFKNDLSVFFWFLIALLGVVHVRNKQKVV